MTAIGFGVSSSIQYLISKHMSTSIDIGLGFPFHKDYIQQTAIDPNTYQIVNGKKLYYTNYYNNLAISIKLNFIHFP
jgi:hypothetical protein